MLNVSKFETSNVADACALWNLLSSRLLYSTSFSVGVRICTTDFVIYECMHKPSSKAPERAELQARLREKMARATITPYSIDIEDLQDIEVLRTRKRVSIGELSAIIFARKTRQAVLTDDIKAQKLAKTELGAASVQSTSQLVAWLYFTTMLNDGDKELILAEMTALGRNLQPHLDRHYAEAQRCRLMASMPRSGFNDN